VLVQAKAVRLFACSGWKPQLCREGEGVGLCSPSAALAVGQLPAMVCHRPVKFLPPCLFMHTHKTVLVSGVLWTAFKVQQRGECIC